MKIYEWLARNSKFSTAIFADATIITYLVLNCAKFEIRLICFDNLLINLRIFDIDSIKFEIQYIRYFKVLLYTSLKI